jgi:hypothetical protein
MFATLFGAVRADIDRQVDWARNEVLRQTRFAVLIGVLAGVGALATLGAIIVGFVALYLWLATKVDPLVALAIIGGGLLLVAFILFGLAFLRARPPLAPRPQLQISQPAALFGALPQGSDHKRVADREQMLRLAANTLRHASRSELIGTLAVAAVVGLMVGRRL